MARIELSNIGGGGGGGTLTLTTTGTSGASALVGTALNIPVYQGQLTLSTAGTSGASTLVGNTLTIPTYQGQVSLTTTGTSGASTFVGDTLNVPQYQGALTLTTTGTSGAATLVGTTLNIPQYSGGGGTPAGNAGEVQFNSTPAGSFAASSNLVWDNTGIRLNINAPSSPTGRLNVKGGGTTSSTVNLRLTNNGNVELFKILDNGTTTISTGFNYDAPNARLGIGGVSPSARFQVRSANTASGVACVLIQDSTPSDLYKIENDGKITYWATNTAAGTTGAQTINRPSGTVNFAAGASSLVVTNSLCTTSSIVLPVVRTNDTTATIKNVVPGAGSFTINLEAAATAETSVGFFIIN